MFCGKGYLWSRFSFKEFINIWWGIEFFVEIKNRTLINLEILSSFITKTARNQGQTVCGQGQLFFKSGQIQDRKIRTGRHLTENPHSRQTPDRIFWKIRTKTRQWQNTDSAVRRLLIRNRSFARYGYLHWPLTIRTTYSVWIKNPLDTLW